MPRGGHGAQVGATSTSLLGLVLRALSETPSCLLSHLEVVRRPAWSSVFWPFLVNRSSLWRCRGWRKEPTEGVSRLSQLPLLFVSVQQGPHSNPCSSSGHRWHPQDLGLSCFYERSLLYYITTALRALPEARHLQWVLLLVVMVFEFVTLWVC